MEPSYRSSKAGATAAADEKALGTKVLLQGELSKQTGRFKVWSRRWFVLDSESLSYYSSEKAYLDNDSASFSYPIQGMVVEVEGRQLEISFGGSSFPLGASLSSSSSFGSLSAASASHMGGNLKLKAASEEVARNWANHINSLLNDSKTKESMWSILLDVTKSSSATAISDLKETRVPEDSISRTYVSTSGAGFWDDYSSVGSMSEIKSLYEDKEGKDSDDSTASASAGGPGSSSPSSITVSPVDIHKTSFTLDELIQILAGLNPAVLSAGPGATLASPLISAKKNEDFQKCFLLFHKCFIDDSSVLLNRLLELFMMEASTFADKRVIITVRISVITVLQRWVQDYYADFTRPMKLRVQEFLETSLGSFEKLESVSASLKEAFAKAEKDNSQRKAPTGSHKPSGKGLGLSSSSPTLSASSAGGPTAAGATPTFLKKFVDDDTDLFSLEPNVVAEQLTIYESEMFKALSPREFVNREWTKETTSASKAPNLMNMIAWFNKFTFWIASTILSCSDSTRRRHVMKFFVQMMFRCKELDNFWGAVEIGSALFMAPVNRLKGDWASLPSKYKSMKTEVSKFTGVDGDFEDYRKHFANSVGKPQIPHIVLHLRDLFGLDSLDTYTASGEIIYSKYRKQWKVLSLILQAQKADYNLLTIDTVARLTLLKAVDSDLMTKEQMTDASYKIQPRGTDKAEKGSSSPLKKKKTAA